MSDTNYRIKWIKQIKALNSGYIREHSTRFDIVIPIILFQIIFKYFYPESFPHNDRSRIDIRTIEKGDDKTYVQPFGSVTVMYTGYKYLNKEWIKFTTDDTDIREFETRLGNQENIIGLEQGILSMSLGEVSIIWIPSRLGYGQWGALPLIETHTDLIFKLRLLEIDNSFEIEDENNEEIIENINENIHIIDDDNSEQALPQLNIPDDDTEDDDVDMIQ
eukprot:466760_1